MEKESAEERLRKIALSLGVDPKEVGTPAQAFKWANDYAGIHGQNEQSVKNLKEHPDQWLEIHKIAHSSDAAEKPVAETGTVAPVKKIEPAGSNRADILKDRQEQEDEEVKETGGNFRKRQADAAARKKQAEEDADKLVKRG